MFHDSLWEKCYQCVSGSCQQATGWFQHFAHCTAHQGCHGYPLSLTYVLPEHCGENRQIIKNKKCSKSKTKRFLVNKNLKIPLTSAVEKFL